MANYFELPVYKKSYDLLVGIFQLTHNFSKEYKYTVGESLKKETIELIIGIYKVNRSRDKSELIQITREQQDFLSSMNAYLGMMKHYKTYHLRKHLIFKNLSGWWWNYVYLKGRIGKFVMK